MSEPLLLRPEAQSDRPDLWSQAPSWRNLTIGAAVLTAAAIALPLIKEPQPATKTRPAPISTALPAASQALPKTAPTPPPVAIIQQPPAAPKIVYVPIPERAASAPAPVLSQAQTAQVPAVQAAPAPNTVECTLKAPPAPIAFGAGVVVGFENRAESQARIGLIEQEMGGLIDPGYIDNLRVHVRLDDGRKLALIVPKSMAINVGDRVTAQGAYRNAAMACNYIPPLVTADLGSAASSALSAGASVQGQP